MPQRAALTLPIAALALAAALAWATGANADQAAEPVFVQRGEASHYADSLRGRRTASGERFRQDARTAASRVLPLGARVVVTSEETGRSVEVRINDRGPHADGRIIDLSRSAAEEIGLIEDGVAPVRVEARPSAQPTAALRRWVLRKARLQAAHRPPLPAEKPEPPGRRG
jgi:rare lipoprotein A